MSHYGHNNCNMMVCITVPLCGFGMGGKLCQLCVCLCQTCSGFYQQKWVKSSFLPNLTITKFVDTRYHLIQKLLRQIFHCCDHIHSLLKRFLRLYGIQERTNYGDGTSSLDDNFLVLCKVSWCSHSKHQARSKAMRDFYFTFKGREKSLFLICAQKT